MVVLGGDLDACTQFEANPPPSDDNPPFVRSIVAKKNGPEKKVIV